jgi:hypothetical protein
MSPSFFGPGKKKNPRVVAATRGFFPYERRSAGSEIVSAAATTALKEQSLISERKKVSSNFLKKNHSRLGYRAARAPK